MSLRKMIGDFYKLHSEGKSAAIDINEKIGEVALRASLSSSGAVGNGAVPIPYTDSWVRIIQSDKGRIKAGKYGP